jgi:hypothetical protein
MRTEAEEFLTVFNEARNQKQAFFTASQRLNDFSKTIRTKQSYIMGRINSEDITPQIRRIEKLNNIDLTTLALRNWFYNGAVFVSPDWKQDIKPYIINAEIRKSYSTLPTFYKSVPASEPKNKKGFWQRILNALAPQTSNNYSNQQSINNQTENNIKEDEKGDFLMLEDDDLMFSET